MPRLALTACLALLGWAAACGTDGTGGPQEPDLYCAQFQTWGDCTNEAPPDNAEGGITCEWLETRVYEDDACPGVVAGECLPVLAINFGCFQSCPSSSLRLWSRTDGSQTTVALMPDCGPTIEGDPWSQCNAEQGFPCDCACDEFEDDAP